ncbi:hypothetical protein LOTGIDRAFT_172871 [Lottia gigantea]|uniref:Ubiquitin-like domain-containing protein n=1 Tax=Lottia gigantea TaxID=225164 RepID=V4AAM5_LOTGI|nr:hypothetical protein LOTGIDRAFT_172871 [Lottia gigantea]ESP01039.1 hypothetical protein LOTGIDRAFT_172871 [Lottia gigantea]
MGNCNCGLEDIPDPPNPPYNRRKYLVPAELEILRVSTRKVFTVFCNTFHKVEILKYMIYAETRIPPNNQKLLFNNEILYDHQILSACGVEDGYRIDLYELTSGLLRRKNSPNSHQNRGLLNPTVAVTVDWVNTGRNFVIYDWYSRDSILKLKFRIEEVTKLRPFRQTLKYEDIILPVKDSLFDYGVIHNCTIKLYER